MDENLIKDKMKILQWLEELQDKNVIAELLKLKQISEQNNSVNESKLEYVVADDFEERWAKGLTSEESRAETKRRITEWWGK